MKEKVNFAVIGLGKIGRRHCSILAEHPETSLIAVFDPSKTKADETAEKFGVKAYYDYDELLKNNDIDIVSICSPSGYHAKQTIKAAKAKKHIVCEKPMALSLKDCDAMIKTCVKNNVRLFVVKQNRYNESILRLKNAIDKDKLGRLYMINAHILWNRIPQYYKEEPWRGSAKLDGGALMNQSSHFVDLIHWLGGNVKSVYAKMDNFVHDIETEDTGTVILKFENGAIGNIQYTTCIYDKNFEGSLTILGTKGTVKIGGQYLNKIEYWNVEGVPTPRLREKLQPNDYGYYQGSAANHDKFYQNVLDILKGRSNSMIMGSDGRAAVEIILAAKESAKSGKEVFLR